MTTACRITDLRPTQFAIGMREVRGKAEKIAGLSGRPKKLEKYKASHAVPAVLGPKGAVFLIDRHHLSRALYEGGVRFAYCDIIADFSGLCEKAFWAKMKQKKWLHLFDENGDGPLAPERLPKRISELRDDPYRSLASEVRRRGGYKKSKEPFAEFHWAHFFRSRIQIGDGKKGYEKALKKAIRLAQSSEARDLPGHLLQC